MAFRLSAKSLLLLAAKLAVTVGALYLATRRVDLNQLLAIPSLDFIAFGFALAISCGIVVMQGLRWKFVLQSLSIRLAFAPALVAVWFGHLLNNILPTSIAGDLVRSYTLRYDGAARGVWFGALIEEKFAAVFTALFLAVAFSFAVPQIPVTIRLFSAILFIAMLASLIGLLALQNIIRRHSNVLIVYLGSIAHALERLFLSSPGRVALLTSLGINVLMAAVLFLSAHVVGARPDFAQCLFVAPLVSIVASLPISYGGWGLRELSGLELLKFLGVQPELALAALLIYGVINLLSSLPGVFVAQRFLVRTKQRRDASVASHLPSSTPSNT